MSNICILSRPYKDNILECTACNHFCKISLDHTWICWIRKNINWKLILTVYGKVLWLHIDPIEKKPLYHFLPWTEIFSLWTAGCNFRCDFCQNWSLSQAKAFPSIISQWKDLSPKEAVQYCIRNKIPSIAYTYTEPTVFFEYAFDTMKLAHKHWIKNIWVSNWFMSQECLEKIEKYLDAINIDLKSFNNEFYLQTCGWRLQPILDNIKWIQDHKIRQELTTLIIPWKNDSNEEITKIATFIYNISPYIPRHISVFHGMYKMKDVPQTSLKTLERAYGIWKSVWLKYIYIGNFPGNCYENTYCHICWYELISRDCSQISINYKDWLCPECKTKITWIRE